MGPPRRRTLHTGESQERASASRAVRRADREFAISSGHEKARDRVVLLTIAALVGGAVYESKQEDKDAAAYKPAGKLIDAGGRKVHLVCAGQGAPTVIFESSALSSSTEWEKLLPEVAKTRRACAYDRAGMGWSEPVPGARTAATSSRSCAACSPPPAKSRPTCSSATRPAACWCARSPPPTPTTSRAWCWSTSPPPRCCSAGRRPSPRCARTCSAAAGWRRSGSCAWPTRCTSTRARRR